MSKYISGIKNQYITISSSGSISNTSPTGTQQFPNGSASSPSITFASDTNTGIYRPSADFIGFTTNGSERLTIGDDGSLRLGGYDLNESGNPNLFNLASEARTNAHAEDTVLYATGPNEKLIETRLSNGTQGIQIGYNSITASGNNTDQSIIINPKGAGTIIINDNQGIQLDGNIISAYGAATDIDLFVSPKGTGNIISENGNFGIGTTSPQYKLSCTNSNNEVCFYAADENQTMTLFLGTPASGGDSNAMKVAIIAEGISNWSRSKLHFCLENTSGDNSSAANATLSDSKMTIIPDGNVGIHNIDPIGTLSLGNVAIGNTNANLTIAKNNGGGGFRQARLAYNNNFDFVIGDYGSANNNSQTWTEQFKINYQAPADSLVIISGGNVGLGISGPTSKLHIDGGNLKQSRRDYIRTSYQGRISGGSYVVTYSTLDTNNLSGYLTYNSGDGSFTINKSGMYSITATIIESSTSTFWIDRNAAVGDFYTVIAAGDLLVWNSNTYTASPTENHSISWTGFLAINDNIMIKSSADSGATAGQAALTIVLLYEC